MYNVQKVFQLAKINIEWIVRTPTNNQSINITTMWYLINNINYKYLCVIRHMLLLFYLINQSNLNNITFQRTIDR